MRIVIIEDLETDAELARYELDRELGPCQYRVVDTEKDFLHALDSFDPELIISDYMLPRFDGMKALKIAVEECPDIPFIIFTGSTNEDTAVECMKAGAWDYVIKEHLKRLGTAVRIALKEKESRSQKRITEEALFRAGKEWRATFDAMNDAICVTDMEGVVIRANEAFRGLVERSWPEVIGKKCSALIQDDSGEKISCFPEVALRNGDNEEDEIMFNGRWFRTKFDPISHESGKSVEIIHIFTDISERKKAGFELQETVEQLRIAHEQLSRHAEWLKVLNAISRQLSQKKDFNGIFNTALGSLEESLHFSFSWIMYLDEDNQEYEVRAVGARGRDWAGDVNIIPGAKVPTRELDTLVGGEVLPVLHVVDIREAGEGQMTEWERRVIDLFLSRSVNYLVVVVLAMEGKQKGLLVLAYEHDVHLSENKREFLSGLAEYIALSVENVSLYNELKKSYIELAAARDMVAEQQRLQALGQIASGIAHDINNTLAPITLYTEALLDTEKGLSDRALKYLGTIKKSTKDIEQVTTRLRAFYRTEVEEESEHINVDELFGDVIEMTKPRWKDIPNKEGVSVIVEGETDPELPLLYGSRSEIRESLVNLVFNSVDAMPEGGHILLRGTRVEDFLVIEVSDTGRGMTTEERERCIEPFFTTKGVKGTGLGLSGVYGMIKRHEGVVDIESVPGEGTTVRLSFPARSSVHRDGHAAGESVYQENLRILLVDDDTRILEVLEEMLSLDGHSVISSESGADALKVFQDGAASGTLFDVVITDLGMPDMDGIGLAKEIRKLSREIPVILLTGWGRLMDDDQWTEGIDLVLAKPPTMNDLRKAFSQVVRTRRD